MDHLAVKYILDLAACRSFSDAAENNYISQSSFSKAISKLERELDLELVDRKQHPIAMTPAGECFCRHFREIEPLYKATLKDLEQFRHKKVLQVLLCPNSYPVIKAIEDFMNETPNLKIQTMSTNQFGHITDILLKTNCDFAITSRPLLISPQMRITTLYDDQLFLAAAKDHPLAKQESVSFSDLTGQVIEVTDFSLSLLKALQTYFQFELKLPEKWDPLHANREAIIHDVILGRAVSVFSKKDIFLYQKNTLALIPFREFQDFPCVLLESVSGPDTNMKQLFRGWLQKHLENYVCQISPVQD